MRTSRSRALALALGIPLLTLTLAACGDDDGGHGGPSSHDSSAPTASASSSYGPAASGPHNEADVAFATDMIPHHGQAVEMAAMALKNATHAQVKALATAIQGAQDPEIRTMSGWLVGWGQPVPDTSGGMHGGGHSMTGAGGMMSDAEMADLAKASGAAFDRMWVDMMTRHHEGAVTMANSELRDGQNSEAKALARAIIAAQTQEIATMDELATTL